MASNYDRRSASSAGSKSRRPRNDGPQRRSGRRDGEEAARQKRAEREQRLAQRGRSGRVRLLTALAVLVVCVVAATAVYRSDAFPVKRYRLVGASHLKLAQVLALAKVPAGTTLLRFPSEEVRQRVAADPWVSSVTVKRRLPDTIEFQVTERMPAALVDGSKCLWLVDGEGWVLEKRSKDTSPTLPVVRQLQNASIGVGRQVASPALRNALVVLGAVAPDLRRTVVAVNAKSLDETALVTKDNVEILFGSADDMPKKDLIARQILAAQRGKVVFIDVRSTDRPVSRGIAK